MQNKAIKILVFFMAISLVVSCKQDPKQAATATQAPTETPSETISSPSFKQDSAYQFIQKQLSFGHRIPGTKEHLACRDWLVDQFKAAGATVQLQEFKASFLGKKGIKSYNIIASFNPNAAKRIMLAAHWDTRLIAEKDANPAMKKKPIMGADDGASGVAILLELGRLIKLQAIDYGVDIVLFDAEDNGEDGDGWCLGSKHWANQMHIPNYSPKYGILLDLVGAKGAKFTLEQYSKAYAGDLQSKIWSLAQNMGYSDYFVSETGGGIEDDHVYVNKAGIPMVDIISMPNSIGGFGSHHHTHNDNIDIIDKRTLQVVGKVITEIVYRENHNKF